MCAMIPDGTNEQPPEEKEGETSDPGRPQPEAAEVESARLLANDSREELAGEGFSDERIRELADEFIARNLGQDPADFIGWAKQRGPG